MNCYCIPEFKQQYDRLLKKKSYGSIAQSLFEYLFNKSINELKSGTNINNNTEIPFIKKRIEGSGGFRLYYLLLIFKDNIYLAYIHPKTGSMGKENLSSDERSYYQKQTHDSIKKGLLYSIGFKEENRTCTFEKLF